MPRLALFALLAALPLAGCAVAKAPGPATVPPYERTDLRTTEALTERREVAVLVDEIAAANVFTSERIGFIGEPSASFIAYERLRSVASDAEMKALLFHENAAVRSYAVKHAITSDLDHAPVEALLRDETLVSTQFGCIAGEMPIALVTVGELCEMKRRKRARTILIELASTASELRDQARDCLQYGD